MPPKKARVSISPVKSSKATKPKMKDATTQTSTAVEEPKNLTSGNNSSSHQDVFQSGCIVSINGYDLDVGRYQSRKNAPIFHGTV